MATDDADLEAAAGSMEGTLFSMRTSDQSAGNDISYLQDALVSPIAEIGNHERQEKVDHVALV